MSNIHFYLWLIPGLPLLAAALIAFLGPRLLRKDSHWLCILAIAGSALLSFAAYSKVRAASAPNLQFEALLANVENAEDAETLEKLATETTTLFKQLDNIEGHEDLASRADAQGDQAHRLIVAGGIRRADMDALKESLTSLLKLGQKRWEDWSKRPVIHSYSVPWITAGQMDVEFALRLDALSAMMLVMITSIGLCIAIYSAGYMDGERGYPRFFAAMSLFVFSMCMLVLADNFVLLFLGWEGVGLCSYLLIGFWYVKPSAADAARKAFLVTRIGDVGMFLGILMLWLRYGSVEFDTIFRGIIAEVNADRADQTFLFAAALLLFCGAVGKSAQFPLHVWLPDAMEGPTPVSALIHAATMVTAGVYLVARCTPLYMAVPSVQLIIACIGAITCVLAALIALTQNDLKRVLAYSTLSQLGYMFLALGCALREGTKSMSAEHNLVTFAVTAAMFHLFTHAFFKALLFLSAGSVMHAMHHVIDMRRFSGLRHVMPYTHAAFLCGAISLAAVPLTSGFWSKDEILDAVWQASKESHGTSKSIYLLLLGVAVFTAGLTAFYTFRAYFKTFWGKVNLPDETHGHAHESPTVMIAPLMVLAVPAVIIGVILGPTHLFAKFLGKASYFPPAHAEGINWVLMAISTVVGLSGIGLAWLMYVKMPALPGELAKKYQALYQVSLNKFFFDEIYLALVVRPAEMLARIIGTGDLHGIDAAVDLVGQVPKLIGGLFRPVQNGLVQFYALAMVLGLVVFLLALVRSL